MKEITIQFESSGTVTQNVQFYNEVPSDFIEGLESGKYITTISHGALGCAKVYSIDRASIKEIGNIQYQSSEDDSKFQSFKLVEE